MNKIIIKYKLKVIPDGGYWTVFSLKLGGLWYDGNTPKDAINNFLESHKLPLI